MLYMFFLIVDDKIASDNGADACYFEKEKRKSN